MEMSIGRDRRHSAIKAFGNALGESFAENAGAIGTALGESLGGGESTFGSASGDTFSANVALRRAASNPMNLPTRSQYFDVPDVLNDVSSIVSDAGGGTVRIGAQYKADATAGAVFDTLVTAMRGNDADVGYRGPRANAEGLSEYASTSETMKGLSLRKIFQPEDPNHFVIGAFLDGTWNKRGDGGLTDTRPGIDSTNVGLLQWMSSNQSSNFRTQYFQGVGTDPETRLFGGATGAGVTSRAEDAYSWMVKQVNGIYSKNSDATFDFLGVGFSRGALETRMVLRMVNERGIPDTRTAYTLQSEDGRSEVRYDRNIVAPGQANLNAVVFDTVTTGVGDLYNIDLPERAQIYHPIARDEMRPLFPSAPLAAPGAPMSPSWFQPILAGDHSDIGNNHDRGGLGDLNLQLAHQFMTENLGLPMREIPPAYAPKPDNMWIHDMRGHDGVAPPSNSPFVRPLAPRFLPYTPIPDPYSR